MSLSVFEMYSVELRCWRPPWSYYVICDEWHYNACLGNAADLERAKAETREFLGIAELHSSEWARDGNLVRRLIDQSWLWFHRVRDRDPDTDGWWVVSALFDELRRGALLAIKGPRADLFSQTHGTPLTVLAARIGRRSNDEPRLSERYDRHGRRTRLTIARAPTFGGGPLHAAAVAAVGALTGDGDASTLLGNAQPFEYAEHAIYGDSFDIAKTPNEGEPGTWYTNAGSGQMRMFGNDGQRVVDFDFDHDHGQGIPHAHNWAIDPLSGRLGRGPGLRFSLLP